MTVTTARITTSRVHVSTQTTITKTVWHRWGHEIGDVTEYTVGRSGDRMWIRSKGVDLSGSIELLREIRDAINEVIDHG